MLVGTGVDIVEIDRIAFSVERYGARFLERIFTPDEIAYCQRRHNAAESFAARFAAKEAGTKALGTGIWNAVRWTDLEVRREPGRRPTLHFMGRAREIADKLGVKNVSLALSHDNRTAIASVHLEN